MATEKRAIAGEQRRSGRSGIHARLTEASHSVPRRVEHAGGRPRQFVFIVRRHRSVQLRTVSTSVLVLVATSSALSPLF